MCRYNRVVSFLTAPSTGIPKFFALEGSGGGGGADVALKDQGDSVGFYRLPFNDAGLQYEPITAVPPELFFGKVNLHSYPSTTSARRGWAISMEAERQMRWNEMKSQRGGEKNGSKRGPMVGDRCSVEEN